MSLNTQWYLIDKPASHYYCTPAMFGAYDPTDTQIDYRVVEHAVTQIGKAGDYWLLKFKPIQFKVDLKGVVDTDVSPIVP